MGHPLDDDPAPQLYIAPTKSFVENVFEPRFKQMVLQCASLLKKRQDGRREKKTRKEVAGVKIRFAWAGSATELAGEPARDVFVDERDRMDANVDGEGDPVELADARHSTYPDGCTTIFSTPTLGNVETETDKVSGLEFWSIADEIYSPTWKIFQEGTRHHWCVPCPECSAYFVPRFKNLWWPKDCEPPRAMREACLLCSRCGVLIDQTHKSWMMKHGVFVAPGQDVDTKGRVTGDPNDSTCASFWVSGLFSPWKTWGQRASQYLLAVRSGDPERIQAAINTGMGELFSIAGEAPALSVVRALRQPYKLGDSIPQLLSITMGVDVQKDRLYYSVRGWSVDLESWPLEYGDLVGPTDEDEVWETLGQWKERHYGNQVIARCFVDSGYRTQYVYKFCRKFKEWALPTKGRDTIEASPLTRGKLDVGQRSGTRLAGGLGIWHINTDYFKSWLHQRFERDITLPGAWHLAEDTSEEFCKSMVSEARIVKASGRVTWGSIHSGNHYWDCEVNNIAAAYSLNLQSHTGEVVKARKKAAKRTESLVVDESAQAHPRDVFRSNERVVAGRPSGAWFNK